MIDPDRTIPHGPSVGLDTPEDSLTVSLPDSLKAWVARRVASGRYSNASEYVRALIRQDQEEANARDALREALVVGEESGSSEQDVQGIWEDVQARQAGTI